MQRPAIFKEAEIAKLNPKDMEPYEESLKTYRDNYSVLKTAKEEGISESKIEIASKMKKYGDPVEKIRLITGLKKEEIERL